MHSKINNSDIEKVKVLGFIILDGLWQTWSAMRRHGGRASEVDVELEMTSTNDGTFGIDQENPIIAAARERNGTLLKRINRTDDAALTYNVCSGCDVATQVERRN